jgi:hypothetical protein
MHHIISLGFCVFILLTLSRNLLHTYAHLTFYNFGPDLVKEVEEHVVSYQYWFLDQTIGMQNYESNSIVNVYRSRG